MFMTCIAIQLLKQKLSLKRAKLHLGKPYNFSFYPQSDGFYCSEYIAEILPIFDTIPMQFGDEKNLISDFLAGILSGFGLGCTYRPAWDES